MPHILVIDDDLQICKMLKNYFQRKGFEVSLAHNGVEGIAAFKAASPDLVITDLVMPEKEGIETLMDLKRLDKNVNVIAISGGGRVGPESYLALAGELGAKRVFEKPVDFEELLNAVRSLT